MRILLAVDIRADAKRVVAQALPWIARLEAQVDVVFVDTMRASLEAYTPPSFLSELARLVAREERELQGLLETVPAAYRGQAIVDLTTVDEMVQSRGPSYALTVVGTQGRVGLSHLWAGSVAERIVRFSPNSVLVLRDHPLPDPLRALFAIDLTEDPLPLLSALGPLAARLHAQVDLLTLQEIPAVSATLEAPSLYSVMARYAEEARGASAARLATLRDTALPTRTRGAVFADLGSPVTGILERTAGADLVVVGTHGRKGLNHALLGSVAERVVRRADRPVLVLRA